jgi:predicted RNase H-like HicB family nuclease
LDRCVNPGGPGVFSQGRTRDDARANVLDALQLMTSPEPEGDLPHA